MGVTASDCRQTFGPSDHNQFALTQFGGARALFEQAFKNIESWRGFLEVSGRRAR